MSQIGDDSGNQDETKRESETPKPESDDGSEPSTCILGKVTFSSLLSILSFLPTLEFLSSVFGETLLES